MSRIRDVAVALAWLLPSGAVKRAVLRPFGHVLAADAVARPNLVWRVDRVELAAGARIGRFNGLKQLRLVSLGEGASLGNYNTVSTHPAYRRYFPDGSHLTLAPRSGITSRHTFDCSGGITLDELALVAGRDSLFLTHSLDLKRDAQTTAPIVVGARTFVSTRCTVVGGARVPSRSVVAAGAVVTRARDDQDPGLYGGVPARRIGDVDGAWFERSTGSTRRLYLPATDETVERAF